MISEKHTDGGCYKLTVKYMIDPGDGLVSEKMLYSEDIDELICELQNMSNKFYCFDLRIQDDSK